MDKNNDSKKREYLITSLIAVIAAVLAGIFAVCNFPVRLENMAEDGLYQNAGTIPSNIKIIAIDEETLDKLGPYTDWNRGYFADLIEILNTDEKSAPKVIGVDVVFSGAAKDEEDARLVNVCSNYDNIVMASTVTFDSYLYQDVDGKYYSA